jgi:predicted RNA-binding Zn ribbon-like protein
VHFTSYSDAAVTLAEDVVNTYNPVRSVEKLPDVAALAQFLLDRGIPLRQVPTARDLKIFRGLRPAFRSVFDAPSEEAAVALLNDLLVEHRAVPHYSDHDGEPWHLHVALPNAPAVDQLAANAAMGLLAVITTDGMRRLHTCTGNRCAEVFVDISRNQSRRYCSPLICGNRASSAAHRARQRSGS